MPSASHTDGSWTERAWVLFAATSALYFLAGNEADNDLWVHLLLGRRILASGAIPRFDDLSFTAAGAPWVDHEWLAQVVMAFLYDSIGGTGVWLAKVAIGLATAALTWRTLRRRHGTLAIDCFVLVLTLAALSRGFATRPQIFSYLFVAALLAWLDKAGDSPPAGKVAVPLVAVWLCLWANLHGAFIVGLGILGLWAVSPPWQHLRGRIAMPTVALIAACLNPYGPSLFTYIWGELSLPHPLTEWQPVHFGDPTQWPFWIALITLAGTAPFSSLRRKSPWRLVLVFGTAVLALRHQRHVPLFALCAAAPLADQIDGAAARFGAALSAPAVRTIAAASMLMASLQIALLGQRAVADRANLVFAAEEYPVNAVRFAADHHLQGSLALPLDWGGYALWHLSPAMRVSMDGRFATVYPPDVVDMNFDFFAGANRALLDRYQPDFILTPGNVTMPALAAAHYRPVFRDRAAVLYARAQPGDATLHQARRGRIPFP